MLALFTLPTASQIIASTGEYSATFFTEFLPLIYLVAGILLGTLLVLWLTRKVSGGIRRVAGGRRGGRRRRR